MRSETAHDNDSGFSLIELMVAIAIVGILATLAILNFQTYSAKSKRIEATSGLQAIYAAQQVYWANRGEYADNFRNLGWPFEGQIVSDTKVMGDIYTFDLSNPWGVSSWWCTATGDIDNDVWPDVMVMYEARL